MVSKGIFPWHWLMVSDHVMKNSFVTIIITKSNDVDNWVDNHEKDNDGEDEKDGKFEKVAPQKHWK